MQRRAHLEDRLHRPHGRAVVVPDGVRVANLGQRREHDHPDRSVPAFCLVPGDEDRPIVSVGLGVKDHREVLRQPRVPREDAAVVHVVAEVGGDEVVARDRVVLQIGRKLSIGPDVSGARRRGRALTVGQVLEEDERIVLGGVLARASQRAPRPADVLFVGPP